jgi:hypothetical protein
VKTPKTVGMWSGRSCGGISISVQPLVLFAGHLDFTCFCPDVCGWSAEGSLGALLNPASRVRLTWHLWRAELSWPLPMHDQMPIVCFTSHQLFTAPRVLQILASKCLSFGQRPYARIENLWRQVMRARIPITELPAQSDAPPTLLPIVDLMHDAVLSVISRSMRPIYLPSLQISPQPFGRTSRGHVPATR